MAKAFFAAGYWVQTFPVFGSERRGAPVEAYLRLDASRILLRSNVYEPDHVIVQDARLLGTVDVLKGLRRGGWVLLNASAPPDDLKRFEPYRLALVDASGIARELGLGSRNQPITNTAMMGAFARVYGAPPLDALVDAIEAEMPAKRAENAEAARRAYEAVAFSGPLGASEPSGAALGRSAI